MARGVAVAILLSADIRSSGIAEEFSCAVRENTCNEGERNDWYEQKVHDYYVAVDALRILS